MRGRFAERDDRNNSAVEIESADSCGRRHDVPTIIYRQQLNVFKIFIRHGQTCGIKRVVAEFAKWAFKGRQQGYLVYFQGLQYATGGQMDREQNPGCHACGQVVALGTVILSSHLRDAHQM